MYHWLRCHSDRQLLSERTRRAPHENQSSCLSQVGFKFLIPLMGLVGNFQTQCPSPSLGKSTTRAPGGRESELRPACDRQNMNGSTLFPVQLSISRARGNRQSTMLTDMKDVQSIVEPPQSGDSERCADSNEVHVIGVRWNRPSFWK